MALKPNSHVLIRLLPLSLQNTIGQYFATMHCVSCGELTMETMCAKCREEPQVSAVRLCAKMSAAEKDHWSISEVGNPFRYLHAWRVSECNELHTEHSSVHAHMQFCSCVTTVSVTGPQTTLRPVPLWIALSFTCSTEPIVRGRRPARMLPSCMIPFQLTF